MELEKNLGRRRGCLGRRALGGGADVVAADASGFVPILLFFAGSEGCCCIQTAG